MFCSSARAASRKQTIEPRTLVRVSRKIPQCLLAAHFAFRGTSGQSDGEFKKRGTFLIEIRYGACSCAESTEEFDMPTICSDRCRASFPLAASRLVVFDDSLAALQARLSYVMPNPTCASSALEFFGVRSRRNDMSIVCRSKAWAAVDRSVAIGKVEHRQNESGMRCKQQARFLLAFFRMLLGWP